MSFKYELQDDGKTMVVNDPIYGTIKINSPFKEIILTKEMQRLNDIIQNGFSVYDYPGLRNNERLSHSIGAFYVMSQIIEHIENELKRYDIEISKDDKDMALCSMLLHDIGHGPFSHACEKMTKYSHEKRTTDILLGDTEISNLLSQTYGKTKLKRIASYIAEIGEYADDEKKETRSNFTKLLKSLISHQLDADRLDYLVRDSYHAGLPSAIDYKSIINALEISIDSNQEYELLVDKKDLTSIETVLIERFQRYRDVYLSKSAGIAEKAVARIIETYRKSPESVKAPLPEDFKKFAINPEKLSLEDFLLMTDTPFLNAFDIIKENSTNPILSYLCNLEKVVHDYQDLSNNTNPEIIKTKLEEIFPNKDFSNTMAILNIKSKTKLYKKEESLRVNFGYTHKDLAEATPNLIKPEEYLEKSEYVFNMEMLRLELGMTDKEFEPYIDKIKNMINESNKKPEEFELKYISGKDENITQDDILSSLLSNGFKIVKISSKENNDEYYDTRDFMLLSSGGSLRIRKLTQDGKQKYKATYKMPTTVGEVYSSREEIEVELEDNSLQELKDKMSQRKINVNLDEVLPNSLLNSVTQRRDVVLEKNGVQVCLSFDNTTYKNHAINGNTASDSMIEIEALGNVGDRVMLNEINEIIRSNFPTLQINKQSKYERGMRKTRNKSFKSGNDEKDGQLNDFDEQSL